MHGIDERCGACSSVRLRVANWTSGRTRALCPRDICRQNPKQDHQVAYLSLMIPSHVLCHAVSVRQVNGRQSIYQDIRH